VTDFDEAYDGAGRYQNVNPYVLRAMAQTESGGHPNGPNSKAGAIGLMQIMPDTAMRLGIDPHDPVQSIYGAARILSENLDRYKNLKDALSAYNGGTDRSKWGNPETMAYPGAVAANYRGPQQDNDPFAGSGIDAGAGQPATPKQNAFDRLFGGDAGHDDKASSTKAAGVDAFDHLFGSTDPDSASGALPEKAKAHQGTMLGNLATFTNDGVNAAGRQIDKAGIFVASHIPGVSRLLAGTAIDPQRLAKADAAQEAAQSNDWGATYSQGAGRMAGDALVGGLLSAGTAGVGSALAGTSGIGRGAQAVANLLSGTHGNALARVIGGATQGAGTAELTGEDPRVAALGGGVLGALSPKIADAVNALSGAGKRTASRALNALAPREQAEAVQASGAGADAPASAIPESAAGSAPDPVKIGLFASPKKADQFAQRIYDEYGKGAPVALVQSKIPGVQLTASQATGNPGLALIERNRRAANPTPFQALDAQNAAARNAYAEQIIGTPEKLDSAIAARAAVEQQLRPQIFGNQAPVDTAPIRDHLQNLIDANRGRSTVQEPLKRVMDQLDDVSEEDGTALPENLWNVRKYLGDIVSPAARGTATSGHAAASQLLDLKPTITDAIEGGAPGFKGYLSRYEEASRPIDAMGYLQARKLTNAQGEVQLGKLDSFLGTIKRDQNKPGYREADSVTKEQLDALTTLRDDMRLASRIDLGKARGSDTNVNLATSSKVANMAQGLGPRLASMAGTGVTGEILGGPGGGAAGAMVGNALAGAVSRRIANRLANTQDATFNALDARLLNPSGR